MAVCAVAQDVTSMLAPHLLAWNLNWTLYGVLAAQLYAYHATERQDNKIIRLVVYGTFLIETAQTLVAGHDANAILVGSWGCSEGLYRLNTTYLSTNILPSVTGILVQCLSAWRVRTVSKSTVQPMMIVALSVVQGSFGLLAGVLERVWNYADDSEATHNLPWTFTPWLVGTAACDIVIFSLIAYHIIQKGLNITPLNNQRNPNRTRLNRVISVVVGTGMLSAITAILCIALFYAFKENHFYFVPSLLLSKVYSNSLLVVLRNRDNTSGQAGAPALPGHVTASSQC